ncbi:MULTISPECIES: DNA helicase PcrA [unclassified Fusibacter]|uniref:DNA helicase PcrA n=1 Tax=unclassified Fusibacter TaxID=2624464 RepID=UPI0019D6C3C5|nr:MULTISPECIES: DNA helicase PcrA [unclassified Fusibacter]MCK8060784.1 DNA helicase PcrA [Fusibacter sp. A2]
MDLQILNERQREAVEHIKGPLLVLAGAGSGKTRVLTYRIAYLIEDQGVLPSNILALTFTNKAANEMRHRVEKLIGGVASSMWIGTFHSICVRILRRDADVIGFTKDFVIYDTADQKTLTKNIMKRLNISDKDLKINFVRAKISEAKNEMISPEKFQDMYTSDYQLKQVGKIYGEYQKEIAQNNAMDFDDLLLNTLELFRVNPEILEFYQRKFQFIHVDEYQDTNGVQYSLVRKLAARNLNLCVVGDNDQSIYGWRGADIRNIQDFEKDFKDGRVVLLEQNYRSTRKILDLANGVIQNNPKRRDKNLWTDNHSGEDINYYRARDNSDEARYVANEIIKRFENGASYNEFAVLYRTNAQSRDFEEAFIRASIPYKIIGGLKFYERKEVKDLISYLRLIANPSDEISLQRIINTPKRGIGDKTVENVFALAHREGISAYDAIELAVETKAFPNRALSGLKEFFDTISPFVRNADNYKGSDILDAVIKATGYRDELVREGTIEAQTRIENIDELYSQILNYESMHDDVTLNMYLQEISLLSDQDDIEEDESGHILLMTIHAAKGLEFPTVFLVGLEERLFPSEMTMETDEGVEEERRLCYVGITRAEQTLHLTHAAQRMRFGRTMVNKVSRFIDEMPKELIFSHSGEIATREASPIQIGPKYKTVTPSRPVSASDSDEFRAGVKVRHQLFGDGMVISVKGAGENAELTIAFDKKGIKKLMLGIAPLSIVD